MACIENQNTPEATVDTPAKVKLETREEAKAANKVGGELETKPPPLGVKVPTPRAIGLGWITGILATATAAILFAILFYISDELLGQPVGGSYNPQFDKAAFGQTIGQLTASIADTNLHLLLGLFLVVGFALAFNSGAAKRHFHWLVLPLCLFALCAVLAVYFAVQWKLGLLVQVQFNDVHIDRIEMAFRCHMYALLGAALACFAVVLIALSATAAAE
jgi:uncharacterized membrane protein